jgi:integrase
MPERLTDVVVRNAEPPDHGQRFIWDTEIKRFALRVTARGAKSFVLDYRVKGLQRRITIGSYPDWKVAAARNEAKAMKREVDRGGDPMGERHEEATAPTVRALWDRYERNHLPTKAARTQADERAMWQKLILPALGTTRVSDVTHEDIEALHHQITNKRNTPIRANRTVEVFRKALNLAIRWGWRTDNPAKGVRRNPEEKRTRYLSQQELARLSAALAEHPETVSVNAIRLIMLTGARRGEVLNARWDQFDLDAGIWVKPSAHTKQRREHRVPLSAPALALLSDINKEAQGQYVFPGKTEDQPLTDLKKTWASVTRKAGVENARVHDLRHTFASILVSRGASLPLIGALLGHTQPATTARYAHLYDEPLREAAELVGSALEESQRTGNDGPSQKDHAGYRERGIIGPPSAKSG